MSSLTDQQNKMQKRFRSQVAIAIDDSLYNVDLLTPTSKNRRFAPVHDDAVERLNQTMKRLSDGNAQVYYTMVYKDVSRVDLIKKWVNKMKQDPSFKTLPLEFQKLEIEQCRKLGDTSRFDSERLMNSFISHVDEEAKARNQNLAEYRQAAKYFTDYLEECCKEALNTPEGRAILSEIESMLKDSRKAAKALPHDKVGGDRHFENVDRKVQGTVANDLYLKDVPRVIRGAHEGKCSYYELFTRVQNKGNTFIGEDGEILDLKPDAEPWLPTKVRAVQGDSRTWQIILKPVSNLVTKLLKLVSMIFVGWTTQEEKNEVIGNTMKEFHGKYLFDSFDASEWDASTDPENFRLGIQIIFDLARRVIPNFNLGVSVEEVIDHYLHDPTLTPWGAYWRDSTPSGHNFTGPNGTMTNSLRCYVQTARTFNVAYAQLNKMLHRFDARRIALFMHVGDDAEQLRKIGTKPTDVAAENDRDGFKNNAEKVLMSPNYIHFLQFGYFYDGTTLMVGFYPASRVVEHGLFQERANQYTAESVAAQAIVQNINNCRYNPLQDCLIDFFIEGDKKYRLGADIGVINLFKIAAKGKSVADFLNREWDPSYSDMSWEQYSEVLRDTVKKIESRGRKGQTKPQSKETKPAWEKMESLPLMTADFLD